LRTVEVRIEDTPAGNLRQLCTERKQFRSGVSDAEFGIQDRCLRVPSPRSCYNDSPASQRQDGGALKKRRRIEVFIERRELSVFSVSSAGVEAKVGGVAGGADSRGASESRADKPASCPTCGSTEMLTLGEAMALVALDPLPPGSGAERSNVHCMFSTSEEWWVCKPSLHLS
jgi:hypothetical protein